MHKNDGMDIVGQLKMDIVGQLKKTILDKNA